MENKIAEIEKGCGKLFKQKDDVGMTKCGKNILCPVCKIELQAYKESQEIFRKEIKKFCDEILQPLTNLSVKVERKNYFKFISKKETELLKNLGISGGEDK